MVFTSACSSAAKIMLLADLLSICDGCKRHSLVLELCFWFNNLSSFEKKQLIVMLMRGREGGLKTEFTNTETTFKCENCSVESLKEFFFWEFRIQNFL